MNTVISHAVLWVPLVASLVVLWWSGRLQQGTWRRRIGRSIGGTVLLLSVALGFLRGDFIFLARRVSQALDESGRYVSEHDRQQFIELRSDETFYYAGRPEHVTGTYRLESGELVFEGPFGKAQPAALRDRQIHVGAGGGMPFIPPGRYYLQPAW